MRLKRGISIVGSSTLLLCAMWLWQLDQSLIAQTQPSNPCRVKSKNPCNPCAKNPCNPCSDKGLPDRPTYDDEAEARILEVLGLSNGESKEVTELKKRFQKSISHDVHESALTAVNNKTFGSTEVELEKDAEGNLNPLTGLTVGRELLSDGSPNPFLTDQCKKEAAKAALAHLAFYKKTSSREEAEAMLHAHGEHQGKSFATANGVSYAKYLAHISECKEICRPMMATYASCHVLSVSKLDHSIVLFDTGSSTVSDDEAETVRIASRKLKGNGRLDALLIGRASRLGPRSNPQFNRRLSGSRSMAVRDILLEAGLAEDRVHVVALGWEIPRLSQEVAQAYKLQALFQEKKEAAMNQSVIIVLYDHSFEDGQDKHSHD